MPELLVIKPSSFGDIIHALQVIQTLVNKRPEINISWVVGRNFAPLIRACPFIDEVFEFKRDGGLKAFWKLCRQLRERKFDVVLDMQGLARSGLMAAASRSPLKIGRSDSREGARFFYNRMVSFPDNPITETHAVEILLQFLKEFDLAPVLSGDLVFDLPTQTDIPLSLLERRPIVIFPDSRRPEKEWKGFAALTDQLMQSSLGIDVVWAGSQVPEGTALPESTGFTNLVGQTSISDLILLFSKARLVVVNDSGPLHLAAAMGVPVVGIFGPTSPEQYGPFPLDRKTHRVVRAPNGNLSELDVSMVLKSVESLLADIG